MTRRPRRERETFGLDCFACDQTIEIATKSLPHTCPRCGACFEIQFRKEANQCQPAASVDIETETQSTLS
jgi:predicted RNA-binding Zn-ribbon protein involved in translation (DUF1610 family)